MMSIWATSTGQDFLAFAWLGIRHIVAREAADHILFLVALAAAYRPAEWRSVLWVVTAFTVGHSISLALAVSGRVPVPSAVIELAIACTIMVTAVENLVATDWSSGRGERRWSYRYRPALAGVFGLVHGAGFAEYLRALFVERVAVPLAGFNAGIEIGQVLVLSCAAVALVGLDRAIDAIRAHASWWRLATHRSRVVLVSSLVAVVAARWVVARAAW